jgi:drug/metabolite transporter (DMT)-like permease
MKLRFFAVLAAILVTLLWSSSYFLNVVAFNEGISPMTLAGLRYTIAAVVLFTISVKGGIFKQRKDSPLNR